MQGEGVGEAVLPAGTAERTNTILLVRISCFYSCAAAPSSQEPGEERLQLQIQPQSSRKPLSNISSYLCISWLKTKSGEGRRDYLPASKSPLVFCLAKSLQAKNLQLPLQVILKTLSKTLSA